MKDIMKLDNHLVTFAEFLKMCGICTQHTTFGTQQQNDLYISKYA